MNDEEKKFQDEERNFEPTFKEIPYETLEIIRLRHLENMRRWL